MIAVACVDNPAFAKDEADDFVIATGETRSVRDFCTEAFKVAGMPLRWEGTGVKVRRCARASRFVRRVDIHR